MPDVNTPTESDQADMAGTSMDDLPGADGTDSEVDVDMDAEEEGERADELEDGRQDAAKQSGQEGSNQ